MAIPLRPRIECGDSDYWIETSDDGSLTLVRKIDGVAFHSGCGAAAECDHVYLQNGGLDQTIEQWPGVILEVGLGTGLAMLRTVDRFLAVDRPLCYHAIERELLSVDLLKQLHAPENFRAFALLDSFLGWWDSVAAESRSGSPLIWTIDAKRSVTIHPIDWRGELPDSIPLIDTIYFDPFDPATNPELWTSATFANLFRRTIVGGRLVSYCVKGDVRRSIASAGWHVQRVPGPPGGKREVLRAIRSRSGENDGCAV